MKRLALFAVLICFALPAMAQENSSAESNPITSMVKQQVKRYGMLTAAGAEEMPADKYDYKPVESARTFGELMLHVAQFNSNVCSRFGAGEAPDVKELKATEGKDKLVAAVKGSFDFCEKAIAGLDDSKLGGSAGKMGPMNLTTGGALLILAEDWFDHYSTEALYLRMNGLLPPSAAPRKRD